MNPSFEKLSSEESQREPLKTPERLMRPLELAFAAKYSRIDIRGKENLGEIEPGRKVVIVATHISDEDMPLAVYSLGHEFKLAIADHSTHHNASEDFISYLGNSIAGMDNFLPVSSKPKGGRATGEFNPDDFDAMQERLERGEAVLIAAHNPTYDWKMPKSGGIGAAYLSELADAVVLPVAINLKAKGVVGMVGGKNLGETLKNIAKTFIERPEAEVKVGKPFELDKVPGIERLKTLLEKYEKEPLNKEERDEFRELKTSIQKRSGEIMEKLAEMLPKEKRGSWGSQEAGED